MRMLLAGSLLVAAWSHLVMPGFSAEKEAVPAPDKSRYHLFNPTPREFLREMSTDRPDKTESPYTLDAGHFQCEMDVLTYTRDHDTYAGADTRTSGYSVAPVNLKVGVLNRVDFQLILETWNRTRTEDRIAGITTRQSGFGDVIPRVKLNLWGDDGGTTAFALIPFVKIPANQHQLGNNAVEGGLILPLAVAMPLGFSMGLMTEFDLIRDGGARKYHPEFINTVTFSRDLVGSLGGYVEFFSLVSKETDARWIGTLDLGFTYGLSQNVQIDAGINIGVTKSADDLNPFLGVSFRY